MGGKSGHAPARAAKSSVMDLTRPALQLALAPALLALLATPLVAQEIFSEEDFDQHARRAAPRDAFPVLEDPELFPADEVGDRLDAEEPVIGVVLGGEATAWPISVMGRHELANATIGGVPAAVSW